MAPFRSKILFGCLLVLVSAAVLVKSEESDDEAIVETEEEVEEYTSPDIPKRVYFAEHFDDSKAFAKRWVKSEAKKQGVDEEIAKYDGKWELKTPSRKIFRDDLGLVLTTEAKHAAISALLDRPFEFKDKPFVVQYEVTMQEGQNCGGAYIKLLSRGSNTKADLRQFHDQTAYTIMFGPDKCGNDNKLHFIFRHKNPKNGTIEEKHSKKPHTRLDDIYKDKQPHLYTLIIRPDNTFTVLVDSKEVNSGSLLEDFTPAVNPPEEIDDPNDKKPEDWDEREKIVDPTASKPEDWDEDAPAQIIDPNAVQPTGWLDDEPDNIPDPEAKKPEDWDEEMDGEWEAPLIDNPLCATAPGCGPWAPPTIPNPNYKGAWRAPLISNPNYRGKWTARRIPNPHYFKDDQPFKMTPIHAVGLELWSMSPQLLFDNLIITDEELIAELWASQTFKLKRAKLSRDSKSWWGKVLRATNYNPGYWAMYAVYCSIPVCVYVALLVRRAREVTESIARIPIFPVVLESAVVAIFQESVFERALQFAGDNPWMYAVVIFGTFIVVGLIVYMCYGPSSDSAGDSKKTDAVAEDDPHESEPESDSRISDTDEVPQECAPRGKADLEGPEEVESAETVPVVDTEGAGDGQRKRKARKE